MNHRIISAILVVFLTVVCSPDLIKGQSTDSLLYLIDNDLVKDGSDKYDIKFVDKNGESWTIDPYLRIPKKQ